MASSFNSATKAKKVTRRNTGLEDEEDEEGRQKVEEAKQDRQNFLVAKHAKILEDFYAGKEDAPSEEIKQGAAEMLADKDLAKAPKVQLVRIGLTMDQVRQYNPPPNEQRPRRRQE
jgi:hypothetical protein